MALNICFFMFSGFYNPPGAFPHSVIPGLFFLFVIHGLDPGIQVNHMASLSIWIAGSSPAMTKEEITPG